MPLDQLALGHLVMQRSEVHAVAVSILEDRRVGARVAFPLVVGDQRNIATDRPVHLQPDAALGRVDQVIIDHQFES